MKKRTLQKALEDWHKAWDTSDSGWAWNLHHDVELEPLVAPPIERLKYILKSKPKNQWILRIDNFRPLEYEIPTGIYMDSEDYEKKLMAMVRAYKKYEKSLLPNDALWALYLKSYRECTKVAIVYIKELKKYAKVLKKAHNCDVPGNTWNGKNIFKKRKQTVHANRGQSL